MGFIADTDSVKLDIYHVYRRVEGQLEVCKNIASSPSFDFGISRLGNAYHRIKTYFSLNCDLRPGVGNNVAQLNDNHT